MEQLGDGVYFAEIRQVPGRYVAGTSSGECACVCVGGTSGGPLFSTWSAFWLGDPRHHALVGASPMWRARAPAGARLGLWSEPRHRCLEAFLSSQSLARVCRRPRLQAPGSSGTHPSWPGLSDLGRSRAIGSTPRGRPAPDLSLWRL